MSNERREENTEDRSSSSTGTEASEPGEGNMDRIRQAVRDVMHPPRP